MQVVAFLSPSRGSGGDQTHRNLAAQLPQGTKDKGKMQH